MRTKKIISLASALWALSISGCIHHSTPSSQTPSSIMPSSIEIWVDQDGTFYPNNWEHDFGKPNVRGAYSLSRNTYDIKDIEIPERKADLAKAESETLNAIANYTHDKKRIFILVHGFNNTESEAYAAYKLIKHKIGPSLDVGVIEFYWDGLSATGALPAKIWFNAAGYSQLAGSKGLRKVLNSISRKEIIFITHSRGASVFLSALSDPPYDKKFITDTEKQNIIKVYSETPLKNNMNSISCLMLAPAIGLIDFKSRAYPSIDEFRNLDSQVRAVLFSINTKDPTLNKYVHLSGKFNPTNLGLKEEAGKKLKELDNRYDYKVWMPMGKHGFTAYVKNPQFTEMLQEITTSKIIP